MDVDSFGEFPEVVIETDEYVSEFERVPKTYGADEMSNIKTKQTITEHKIVELHTRLDNIELLLREILDKVNKYERSADRLEAHISFVERTYETLRTPIDYIRDAFSARGGFLSWR